MESPTKPSDTATSANPTDDAFGLTFGALTGEDSHPQLDGQWRRGLGAHSSFPAEEGEKPQTEAEKTAEQRLAEPSGTAGEHASLMPTDSAKEDDKATEISPQPVSQEPIQATQKTPTEMPRKSKPAITINTGLTGVGSKRPPPTPVLPPTFSWNDILRVQNLIERCLQQYLTKNEILVTLREQANVDPAFANVVWQKLEEQNPTFFRAYSIQLQLKEQIIAFNYLVRHCSSL
ncbi:hypothetical protein PHYBOEH_001936 [Phytophthora boehmeriae]|uniref:Uncharacterized protein n=1 Tax=Phytophthora boehmeriae TaxID=109152 RepID=A0A8T1WRG9_9STRA|nr:hypothetical protein PHYBOEH_001936 [Phytophthora boehmeriae]